MEAARAGLRQLFPSIGPWTSAVLWQEMAEGATPTLPPADDELVELCAQKLAPMAVRYFSSRGVALSGAARRLLQATAFSWTQLTLSVVESSLSAVEVLNQAGIATAISKGPGIARLYPSRQMRPYSDLDLILPAEQFDAAVAALENVGWTEEARNRQPWSYFRRYCREGLNLRRGVAGGVDLHHRVPPWIWGAGLSPEALHRASHLVTVGGHELRCLADVDNLLVAALHVVSDRNRPGQSLMVWRDVAQLAHELAPAVVVDRAVETGMAGWLRAILEALPLNVRPVDLVAALPEDAEIGHPYRLARVLSDRSEAHGVVRSQLLRLPIMNGVAFAAGMAVPSREFLRAKSEYEVLSYRRWWFSGRFQRPH